MSPRDSWTQNGSRRSEGKVSAKIPRLKTMVGLKRFASVAFRRMLHRSGGTVSGRAVRFWASLGQDGVHRASTA